jgi:hypothetical protein
MEGLWWPTNTQQNSRLSQNIQGSRNQQTKQIQKQPRTTQGHPNKTVGNPITRITRGLQTETVCGSVVCLFTDALSSSSHIASNDSMIIDVNRP